MTHEEALKPIDSAIWEMSEAFQGLEDRDVWVRAHPRLLSIGELAAHVAYGEATWLYPELVSPLVVRQASYYPHTVDGGVTLEMGTEDLYAEVKRVHEACRAHVLAMRPDLEAVLPWRDDWTWGYTLEYMAFHAAYHTGQMYSVRHLMGHETADN
ncbi:MAG: DUF664 domain-containing protein [Chthonomonas sp.]|nr:DUF664 domain-containing protein [Chthonomonas sp.]